MVPVTLLISKNPWSASSRATSPYVILEFLSRSTSSAAIFITNWLMAMSRGTDASYETFQQQFQIEPIFHFQFPMNVETLSKIGALSLTSRMVTLKRQMACIEIFRYLINSVHYSMKNWCQVQYLKRRAAVIGRFNINKRHFFSIRLVTVENLSNTNIIGLFIWQFTGQCISFKSPPSFETE